MRNERWRADLALGIVALIWGTTFVVVKGALDHISTMYFLTLRFWLASVCMLLLFIRPFMRSGLQALWRGLRAGAIAGIFLWLGYTLQTFGLKYTSAANSGFLTGMYIVLVPLISAAIFQRWPRSVELAGLAVAAVGMVLMTAHSLDGQFHFNVGDPLTLGCAVAYAIHLLLLGYYSQRERFEAVALGQIACTAVFSTVSLVFQPPQAQWSSSLIFAIALTGILATAVAFALQTWGQKHTSATRTALIFSLEPVFALVTAVLIGGEMLTVSAVVGGALILAGILAVELKPAQSPASITQNRLPSKSSKTT